MPWKNTNNWLSADIIAAIFSFVLAFFRAVYIGDEPSFLRRLLEATICGMITLSASYGIDAMGWHDDLTYVAAGAIGFLGADYIRSLATKIIDKKAGL